MLKVARGKANQKKAFFFACANNKGADQLHGNNAADQCLCFGYIDSTIPLLPKASSFLLWLYSLVCVGPGTKF